MIGIVMIFEDKKPERCVVCIYVRGRPNTISEQTMFSKLEEE